MHPALSILITLTCLGAILATSAWAYRSGKLRAEGARKAVHIGMGLLCLSFPWLFSSALGVQILSACAIVALLIVRTTKLRHSVGTALFSVKRISIGELLFPAAVGWLFTLSWDQPLLYAISILLLTLADAAGALAGSQLGKKIYQTSGGKKSQEGSLAFLLTAFICTALPLYFYAPLPLTQILLLSLILALFTMAVEGASGHGLDNLLIPIGSYLLLDYYIDLSADELLLRSLALLILLGILLATQRKHSLNGGATLTALLYSFAAFTLGGIPCLLATVILFIRHILVQRCLTQQQITVHSIDVIFAISLPSLTWLTLGRGKVISYPDAQFGFICTLAIIIYLLNTGTQKQLQNHPTHKNPSMHVGFALSILTLCPALLLKIPPLHYLPTLLIAPALAWIYFYWRGNAQSPSIYHWIKLSLLAFIGSSITMFILLP